MITKAPYTTIYERIVSYAVSMLNEHKHWDAEKAIGKAAEQSRLFHAYYQTLKPAERAAMERLVIARHKGQADDWQAGR